MKLSSAIVGEQAGPLEHELDARWLMAYSAGLGEADPRYYDTARGVLAHPLFPVCYEWPVAQPLRALPALKPLFPQLLHAQHDLVIHRAPRAGDALRVTARIVAVTQRKPGAFVVFRFQARDERGERVTTTDFGALYRGVTVEGGDRRIEPVEDPKAAPDALPKVGEIHVAANAAHVYTECARIWNPIHTDIAYARAAGLPDIILHGTATLALSISRALQAFRADPARARRVQCRFAGMVRMPSTLQLHAASTGKGILFETRDGKGEPVISRGTLLLE
ncbi:MAG TPA: MaoC/PaaZ C-terminal domain-containing protein [Burkholderiales bacterium]|nr:MaoC/PaaZ C-terminal domain-containing protein [Burkholderiales bacterium]